MCGIVGYIGLKKAQEILIDGLSKLEYRGYDSAGVAIMEEENLTIVKAKGKLKNLEDTLAKAPLTGTSGIGHTRWATHGIPSDNNSHPHVSMDGTIAVVHNGIIENYAEIKNRLEKDGVTFQSNTDTEVIPNLIAKYYQEEKDLLKAGLKAVNEFRGSFALGVISQDSPDEILAFRKDSPLIIGLGEGEGYIASDVPAILKHTKEIVYLENGEAARLTRNGAKFFDFTGLEVEKEVTTITWSVAQSEKGGYDHFTLKEIYEQPKALKDTMTGRVQVGEKVKIDEFTITKETLESLSRIYIVACGTAYHAGLAGKKLIESLVKIPVEVEVASEFRYGEPLLDKQSMVIVVSQSGETADTLAVLREAKAKGARVLAITNVVGSSIAREADDVFFTWAGPEIGVASTKAYLTQLVSMTILAIHFAEILNVNLEPLDDLKKCMLELPEKVEEALDLAPQMEEIAKSIHDIKDAYFLGRGLDNVTAVEGSLKLKELTYIHSESYPGGELKHGPIALIEEGTVVIAPVTQEHLAEKMVSNLKEVQTRGANNTVLLMGSDRKAMEEASNNIVDLPMTHPLLTPVVAIVPLQLLAYYVSLAKGFDVDKPRNLAKSVTVE